LGLLLPNVALTGDASAFVLQSTAGEPEKQAATGMLVYNAAYVLKGPGLYVWNGASWIALGEYCPNAITDERDGNFYCTGNFGTAGTWMTQNLRYIPTANADYSHNGASLDAPYEEKRYAFPRSTGNGEYPANPDELTAIQTAWEGSDNLQKMGVFYNWAAATNGQNGSEEDQAGLEYDSNYNRIQGICPADWHLPSDKEWSELTDVIDNDATGAYSTFKETGSIGKKMKSTTPVTGSTNGASKSATAGGFDALLVGDVNGGNSLSFGVSTNFWSCSSGGSSSAWSRDLARGHDNIPSYNDDRSWLFPVRCKQDE
jgi:uncharacterized protein (TIGR02145 family)